ncbi:MAG: cob(I)yrinic acid a,c-diamide adenosyltransferase [Treponema sp.]|jgi:cob(I)alamin adenosyltransferase|nr:cob(I)yrinic acid a,c-diamide adenosyltransferase [Treponema sp.]
MMSGLIHLYIGDGKGKTTAAVGLSVRAAGRDKQVLFAQFLKSSFTGELGSLEKLGVRVIRSTLALGFTHQMNEETRARCKAEQRQILEKIRAALYGETREPGIGEPDLVVLDEALDAVNTGMLDEGDLRSLVETKAPALELVLTGRNPPLWLLDAADYVSEIKKIKHPYDRGIPARLGIER